jgi:hypothetical protein
VPIECSPGPGEPEKRSELMFKTSNKDMGSHWRLLRLIKMEHLLFLREENLFPTPNPQVFLPRVELFW